MSSVEAALDNANRWRQLRCVSGMFWISINIGLSVGLTTVQCEAMVAGKDRVSMTQDQVVWFANIFSILAMVGQLLGGVISNKYGRRLGAMLTCPLYLGGHLCYWLAPNTAVMYAGRVLHGLACGIQHTAVASYISEVSHCTA